MIFQALNRCLLVLLVVALFGCDNSDSSSPQQSGQGKHAKQSGGVNVAMTTICPRSVELTVSTSAQLFAAEQTTLIAKDAGYITKIPVEEGAFVKQGETIVQLDDQNEVAQLSAAKFLHKWQRNN